MDEDTSITLEESIGVEKAIVIPNTDTIELSCPAEPGIRKIFDFELEESHDFAGLDSDGDEAPQQTFLDTHHAEISVEVARNNNGKRKKYTSECLIFRANCF